MCKLLFTLHLFNCCASSIKKYCQDHDILKFGSFPYIIKMLRGIPVLKPYVNLHLHELDNL